MTLYSITIEIKYQIYVCDFIAYVYSNDKYLLVQLVILVKYLNSPYISKTQRNYILEYMFLLNRESYFFYNMPIFVDIY